MRYQMVEDRSVAEQTHEIINLEHALADAEMKLPQKFLVGHWAKLCLNKKAKTGQTAVNMVVGGASTSAATEGYVSAITGRTVSMGNSSTAEVHGIGSVDLKFPSGRVLSLKRVHHVPTDETLDKFILFKNKAETQTGKKLKRLRSDRGGEYESKISGIEVNTIVEFRDAVFIEDVFPMKIGIPSSVSLDNSLASTSIPEHVENMTNVGVNPSSTSLTHEESDEPRRSKRARVVKDFGSDFVTYNIEDNSITFKDAMASSEAKQWKEAVKSEMDSIVSNGTWKLVDLPPGCTTIGCKWIFKKKLKPDGSVDKCALKCVFRNAYKRLVPLPFAKTHTHNYKNIFSLF
ncbi:UNVERIFIED_CONTAM: hypothetical protein Slati_3424500 [Sesamum latifolium]|uniref:Retrovirus-related Pol polyprotein from transposon TNT 1-94-like beta-barrel domain-containing protein n=1 Tax=Sesamum latifolium TaxID=2727402 RepID=A0AAW2UEV9_9LAMI